MTVKTVVQVFDSQGRPVSLMNELGKGGEGSIFEIERQPDLVAKIYHKAIDQERASKLALMAGLRTDRLLGLAAWPIDTLHERPGGRISGFLMRRLTNYKEIHLLYSPKSRLAEFPDASWPFLIHVATNVARAFSVVHDHGHIIGDVNHANILVSLNGTVMLIDCDSFQVTAKGQRYLCEVGISTHTPPELQGGSFRGVTRSINHDAFGLAVIIFQLLFMGRHPFSGAYTGQGEMSLEKAIKELRFAYGPGAASHQMKQPPATLPLEAVSKTVAQLYERAFLSEANRPKPQEWMAALTDMSKSLKQCDTNESHYYLSSLPSCAWCEIEKLTRAVLFKIILRTVTQKVKPFNMAIVWSQIKGVQPPGPPPAIPEVSSLNVGISANALQIKRSRLLRKASPFLLVGLVILVVMIKGTGLVLASVLIIAAFAVGLSLANIDDSHVKQKLASSREEAEAHLQSIQEKWYIDASDKRFFDKMRELETKKTEYENLPRLRQQKLQLLEKNRHERQLNKFLDQFRIDRSNVGGLGPSQTAILQSYGVETAADIESNRITSIPGFTQVQVSKLIEWRRSLEKRFVFNAAQGTDPSDIAALDQEIAMTRARLEHELQNGPPQLRQICEQVKISREALLPAVEESLKTLAQINADLEI